MKFEGRPFDILKHAAEVSVWFSERKVELPDLRLVPPTGAMIFLLDRPVACGFLIRTDAKIAVIDRLVTNPSVDKDVRQAGLEHLIGVLAHLADREGFREVTIASDIAKLWPRFEKMGFKKCLENVSVFRR